MKNLAPCFMLLLVVCFIFSCNKEDKYVDKPVENEGPHINDISILGDTATSIEFLCAEYFKTHTEEAANADQVISVTKEILAINQQIEEFKNKKPSRIQPIYMHGTDGVAYYEVWFTEDNKTPNGWILISATDKEYPLVNFSQGIPYSSHLLNETNQGNKIYCSEVSYYTMEENGRKIAGIRTDAYQYY